MNHADLSSKVLDQSPTQPTINFEYGVLESQVQLIVQQRTNEIKTLMRRNSQEIIEIGQKLIEVKKYLKHGNFRKWLQSEFNWSVSAATKFMQVAEQFKCVNFTHLNITASTLYLIAAPSTPKEARTEVLERASLGESIGYTKAKAIVRQQRKPVSFKTDNPVNVTKPKHYETSSVSVREDLIEKETQIDTKSLLSQEPLPSFTLEFQNKQIATIMKDVPEEITQTSTNIENLVPISHEVSDAGITEMAISIKNLTPEQLTRVIIKAANNGLSEYHLSAIITVCQQVLKNVLVSKPKNAVIE